MIKQLTKEQRESLLTLLKTRFTKNMHLHKDLDWNNVAAKLEANLEKLWSLNEMETSGGEPDVVKYDKKNDQYIFVDCSEESTKGRRSTCYDYEALMSRKEHKPKNNVIDMANDMGISVLNEAQYRELQEIEAFDKKTSSWVQTPYEIRELGGAIFCDYRFGKVFVYHNGAESYYAARGFRGMLAI